MQQKSEKPNQPRVLLACRFPPPYTGETIGSQLVFDLLKDVIPCERFCLNRGCTMGKAGRFHLLGALRTFHRLFALDKHLGKRRYDFVYFVPASSQWGHLRDRFFVRLTRKHVPRIIGQVRSGNFQEVLSPAFRKTGSFKFVHQIDQFIFLSEALSARADEVIPSGQRVVIPNPIDAAVQFTDQEFLHKKSAKSRRRKLCILFISNMLESKGYWDLAEALTLLPADVPWEAHFAGQWGDERKHKEFMDYLAQAGIAPQTFVHGCVSDRTAIKELYRKADFFVLPTYYPVEAQPRSIIEAMNAGTPIIATNHAAIPEYVEDGRNGVLVNKRSPREIADAILSMQDYDEWAEIATATRQSYLQHFSTDVIREQYLDLFSANF